MILAILFASMFSAHAASGSMSCDTHDLRQKEVHTMPGAGYWMQSMDDCRITYTTWGGFFSRLYNYCTNSPEKISDNIDAFPVPGTDGKLYVHPHDGVSFYKSEEGRNDPDHVHAIFSDRDLAGNYESIGLLDKSADGKRLKIRIAMGSARGIYRDYNLVKGGGDDSDYQISTSGDVVDVCANLPNQGLDRELPILSRDGKMIAGREDQSGKSKIYKIGADGSCSSIFTIPTRTGKVSFSFDNRHVAYIITDPRTRNGRLMEADLETGKVKNVSSPDEDVNYMTYKPDGTLVYARGREDRRYHHAEDSDLIMVNSGSVPQPSTSEAKTPEALGMLWAAACGKHFDLDAENAVGSRLTREACLSLANGDLSALDANHNMVTKQMLTGACGEIADSAGAHSQSTQ